MVMRKDSYRLSWSRRHWTPGKQLQQHIMHAYVACVRAYYPCIPCLHIIHAYRACMHACMHEYSACIVCLHAGMHSSMHIMHAYYNGILRMHAMHAFTSGFHIMHAYCASVLCRHTMHTRHAFHAYHARIHACIHIMAAHYACLP